MKILICENERFPDYQIELPNCVLPSVGVTVEIPIAEYDRLHAIFAAYNAAQRQLKKIVEAAE
jgi:hypothetical protein